jgi:hypothetical protein
VVKRPDKYAGFVRRLSYWLIGMAIGFVLLGIFQMARQRERTGPERVQAPVSPSPDPLFPPIPKVEKNP